MSTFKIIKRSDALGLKLTRYYNGKECPHGHLGERHTANGKCVECTMLWKKKNKEKVLAAQSKNRKNNRPKWAEWRKKGYYNNLEKNRLAARDAGRKKAALKPKKRLLYKDEICKKIANRMRCRIWSVLKCRGKSNFWRQSLDYSVDDLKKHLERQFAKGMTWDNFGEWHIDHIVPVVSFNLSEYGDKEFKACWALSNLRPLWAKENRDKWHRRTHLL